MCTSTTGILISAFPYFPWKLLGEQVISLTDSEGANCSAVRAFASMAKSFTPALPPDVSDYIVDMYADMRRRSLQLDG
jgi:DNA replicative helicase MCM subunit Mcm2 (Cdc46/Mcm family)